MKKLIRVVLALACVAATGRLARAADNGTEFGIEDDLTVLGTGGTMWDPDVEIKGFTLFGSTGPAQTVNIPQTLGNIYVSGYVQVSSGMYVAGGSTFTSTVNLPAPASLYVSGGADGQVMTKDAATGAMKWNNASSLVSGDNMGNHIATMTLDMAAFDVKSANYITASSAALSGQLVVYGTSTLTGNTGVGGTLTSAGLVTAQAGLAVTGSASVTNNLTVNGNSQLGSAVTSIHGVNMAAAADTALSVAGQNVQGDYAAKFYSGASLAAWIKKK